MRALASLVRPPHPVTRPALAARLEASMRARGWVGRPVLVEQLARAGRDGARYQGWTGSHRIAAARAAGIEVPIVVVPAAALARAGLTRGPRGSYFERAGASNPARLAVLRASSAKAPAALMLLEVRADALRDAPPAPRSNPAASAARAPRRAPAPSAPRSARGRSAAPVVPALPAGARPGRSEPVTRALFEGLAGAEPATQSSDGSVRVRVPLAGVRDGFGELVYEPDPERPAGWLFAALVHGSGGGTFWSRRVLLSTRPSRATVADALARLRAQKDSAAAPPPRGAQLALFSNPGPGRAVQTIIVAKRLASSERAARALAKKHGATRLEADETSTSYRFRQLDPRTFDPGTFRTYHAPDGVAFVVGARRAQKGSRSR